MATPEDLNRVIAHIETHYGGVLPGEDLAIVTGNGMIDPGKTIDQLRDLHPELFPGGQIPNSTDPPLPAPVAASPPPKLPGPGEGLPPNRVATSEFRNNFHILDQDEYKKYRKGPKSVEMEFVGSFIDGFDGMADAESSAGPGGKDWGERISNVLGELKRGSEGADSMGLRGDAADAMINNLVRSFEVLREMYRHTNSMRMLIADFLNTIGSTKQFFDDNKQLYVNAVSNPDAHPDTINQLNELTVAVIDNFYNPAIQGIAGRHPDLKQSAPQVGSPGPARMSTGPGGDGMGGPPPSELTQKATNLGKPATPPATEPVGPPTAPQVPADALKGLGDAAKGLGDGVQKAAGQAGDAAAGALGAALNGATQPDGTTGAVGGIGPRATPATGHRGSGTTRGLGGGRGGGGVGGVGETKPTLKSAPLTKASSAMGPAPSVSRAGLSGVGGPGGVGGAPAAGPRGDSAGGVHKASKALRSAKQGDEVVGDVEAVVPVIGERADKTPPAKPAE